jgi:glutamine---fructose-6-phosphate transaminase (isomerizing)
MTGERMESEMAEQPARLRGLLARADEIASLVSSRALRGVTIVARGSSDHAATYGRYLLEAATGKPVSMAAPSLHTLYGIRADYRGQLVVAVSQSGQTPEIVETLRRLASAGGFPLAITNDQSSELAAAAHAVVALEAGEEQAVPATKTVTGQMMALALLARGLGPVPFSDDELAGVPGWVQSTLEDSGSVVAAAEFLSDASQLIVVARGFLYGAALETALKIKETCSLAADGYSSADLRHGPIAAVTRGFPVIALNAAGPAFDDMASLVSELRGREARVLTIACGGDVSLSSAVPEALIPILAVVRGQQLAHALALRLGFDPDSPAGLTKVTAT